MILLTVLMPVSMVIRFKHGWYEVLLLDLPFFWTATVSVVLFYVASQREIGIAWWKRLQYLPFIMALGIGMCVNQSKAVIERWSATKPVSPHAEDRHAGPRPELAEEEVPHAAHRAAASGAGAGGLPDQRHLVRAGQGRLLLPCPFSSSSSGASSTWGWSPCCRARSARWMRWIRRPAEDAAPALE